MGVTTGGSGVPLPRKLDGPPTFYVVFGGGNRLRQTGYTFRNFFLEKGSNTSDQEIRPQLWKRGCAAASMRR